MKGKPGCLLLVTVSTVDLASQVDRVASLPSVWASLIVGQFCCFRDRFAVQLDGALSQILICSRTLFSLENGRVAPGIPLLQKSLDGGVLVHVSPTELKECASGCNPTFAN